MLNHISPVRFTIDLIGAWLGAVLFSLACLSLGLIIFRKSAHSHSSKLAVGVTAFLVGEILFSLIFLTFISLSKLSPALVAITILIGFLAGHSNLSGFIAQLPHYRSVVIGLNVSERLVVGLILIGLVFGLMLSSARLGYDATADYFSHAKIMAVSQQPIFFHPKHPFVVSSFHPGILFAALIQLFGDQSARLLSWVNGVAILLMGLALGQEFRLAPRAQLWFLTLMVTSTAFTDLLGDGKIELISTAPILAAIYWMVRSRENPTRSMFVLIGLLSGFAIISRPYNIFLVSLFIALFMVSQAYIQYRAGGFALKNLVQPILWIALPVVALGMFHLVQNWFWLKSPIAPIIYARELDSSDWAWQLDPKNLTVFRLLYPFTLTFMNSAQSLGNISPLLVGVLPFLLLKEVRKNVRVPFGLKQLSMVSLLTLIFWITLYFTVLEIRYVLFLWTILFLPTAQILESATQKVETLFRPLTVSLIIIFLTIMGLRTFMIALSSYFPLNDTRRCLDSNLCVFLETLHQPARPGDRVFVLHGYRYYLRPDLFACSSRVEEYPALEVLARQTSPDFWAEVYRQGFRFIIFEQHLSVDRYGFGKLPSPDIAPSWMKVQVLYSSSNATQRIYQLEVINAPIQPEIVCKQDAQGIWQLTYLPLSRP